MRVAVIFFGLARGVPVTIESIKRHIYACNPDVSFYTIASLNMVETVHNPRNGERGVPLNPAAALLLQADAYAMVRQDDAAIAEPFAAARRQTDYYNNGWISVRNSLHQLASLRRAWRLAVDVLPCDVDYYLFARPDLIYLNEIKLRDIVERFQGSGNLALPSWHGWDGFNDRLAVADAAAARHYANRLSLVADYCGARQFHPEKLLAYALEQGGCRVGALDVKASRVRAHGAIHPEDFGWAPTNIPVVPARFVIRGGVVCFG